MKKFKYKNAKDLRKTDFYRAAKKGGVEALIRCLVMSPTMALEIVTNWSSRVQVCDPQSMMIIMDCAICFGNAPMVDALIAHQPEFALSIEEDEYNILNGFNSLHLATHCGEISVCEVFARRRLGLAKEVVRNKDNVYDGMTAPQIAAMQGHGNIVTLFRLLGAN